MPNNPKPGIQTTEFWLTLASLILGALVSFGVLSGDEAARWNDLLAPAVAGVLPVILYIWSRTRVKAGGE